MQSTADYLSDKTLQYWQLQQSLNGHSKKKVSVEDAFKVTNDIICTTGPARPLQIQAYNLESFLVQGGKKKKSKPSKISNLVQIRFSENPKAVRKGTK